MEESQGSRCEFKVWREQPNKEGGRETVSVPNLGGVTAFDEQYAIVVRQVLDDQNTFKKATLTVNSPYILKVFRDIIDSYPTEPADFSGPFDMESPFQMLYHYWDDFRKRKESTDNDDERKHMELLLDFMEIEMGKNKRALSQSLRKGHIHFSSLWTIFRPGEVVMTYSRSHSWALEVIKTAYDENSMCGNYLEVHCNFTDYDGHNVGVSKQIFKIIEKRHFAGRHSSLITDLPVFPCKFLDGHDTILEELTERGKKFLRLRGISTMLCNGVAEYLKEQPPDYWEPDMDDYPLVWETYAENGRVILDPVTFRKDNFQPPVSASSVTHPPNYTICPPFVHGYSVTRQQWCRFPLTTITEINWNSAAFDSLILPPTQLRLVRALVSAHTQPADEPNKAEVKGKGLVVLLHGPPGSGKTLTAECAAEATKRPLISVSAQSLDKHDRQHYFEFELAKILRLATIWNAVVLFDEADVFLEARSEKTLGDNSISRNALVAVFLRHLEYFAGIVFLTSNRVQVFDAAMRSRLHLALGYEAAGPKSRVLIWSQYLGKIPEEELDLQIEEVSGQLSEEKLNGREIANAINTARVLARYEQVPLQKSHIDSILEVRHDFTAAMKKLHITPSTP